MFSSSDFLPFIDAKCSLPFYHDQLLSKITRKVLMMMMMMMMMMTIMIMIMMMMTGTTSKTFRKYVSTIPRNNEVKELQKTVILGTAHTLRKVLM
jgi:hypothetical protein